jgi:hypothetical protein
VSEAFSALITLEKSEMERQEKATKKPKQKEDEGKKQTRRRVKSKKKQAEEEREVENSAVERAHVALMMDRQIVKFAPQVYRLRKDFWARISARVNETNKK